MRDMRIALAMLVLVACSSNAGASAPTSCDPATQRMGTYLEHWTTVSGNCGPVSDQVVILNGMTVAADQQQCVFTTNVVSDGNCRDDESFSCASAGGQTVTFTGYSVQDTQDGSRLHGVFTVSIDAPACTGTYDITWTRQ